MRLYRQQLHFAYVSLEKPNHFMPYWPKKNVAERRQIYTRGTEFYTKNV